MKNESTSDQNSVFPQMPFPSHYKKALVSGKKTMTVRLDNELSKYKADHLYRVCSYAGAEWGTVIKVTKVVRCTVGTLEKHNIPLRTINPLVQKWGSGKPVDLVTFGIYIHNRLIS